MSTDTGSERKSTVWAKTPTPNLVKHTPSGTYYLRARVGKKNAVRESLKTDNYAVARVRLSNRLEQMRREAPPKSGAAPTALWDALRMVWAKADADPRLKPTTRHTYGSFFVLLKPGALNAVPLTPFHKLTEEEVLNWWKQTSAKYSASSANFMRMIVRRALKLAQESGSLSRKFDVSFRRMRIPRTRLKPVTREQFLALVTGVEVMPNGKAAREWIEFVAYSGMRPEEANQVLWEHVGPDFIEITGGELGTKNHETRRVPILDPMRDLLVRIQARTGRTSGRVLSIRHPRKLFIEGCEKAGIPRMRRYDLRHLFATRCNESGVDIPTIAKWLGHKDGGALAMRTYVHPDDAHERQAAAKVKF